MAFRWYCDGEILFQQSVCRSFEGERTDELFRIAPEHESKKDTVIRAVMDAKELR